MTRKTAICYTTLFKFIENKIVNLEPTEFMTDFEDGMRKAIKLVYPNSILRGCWFHYIRAITRNCLKLGMGKFLFHNAEVVKKQIMSLPLLPTDNIKEAYGVIKELAHEMGVFERFKKFFEYFEGYWLKQV